MSSSNNPHANTPLRRLNADQAADLLLQQGVRGHSKSSLRDMRAKMTIGPPWYQSGGKGTSVYYLESELLLFAQGRTTRRGKQATHPPSNAQVCAGAPPTHCTPLQSLPDLMAVIERWQIDQIAAVYRSHWDGTAETFASHSDEAAAASNRRYLLSQPGLDAQFDSELSAVTGLPPGDHRLRFPVVRLNFRDALSEVERHAELARRGDLTAAS